MNADRLFCDTVLAERIERLEAQLVAKGSEAARRRRGDTVGFVMPIAGGVASFAEAGSPMNKVAGLGFGGVPSADALDHMERAFAAYGALVQIELAHIADPAFGSGLSAGRRATSSRRQCAISQRRPASPATSRSTTGSSRAARAFAWQGTSRS